MCPGSHRRQQSLGHLVAFFTARIGLIDNTTGERVLSEPFTIDVIALFAPNGGELLVAGNIYTITWTTQYATDAQTAGLWYQLAGTDTWVTIGTTTAANSRFDWTVASVATMPIICAP